MAGKATDELFQGIVFPDPMDLRLAGIYINVSEARIRTLLREGTIQAVKDGSGRWSVTKAALDEYVAKKGASRGGGTRGDGKLWIIRVKYENLQQVKDALAPFRIELQPRYNYEKQKAYREKRKASAKASPAKPPAAKK